MKEEKIFNYRELRLLYTKKPELKPIKVPSLDDTDKVRVPSLNEANLLNQPTLDQIIVQFLQQYEVNVEPRSVGEWNGWDTVSTLSSILSSREGSMSNIASTMFYANRSNQINSAAQDWGTWKRWALDHKNFDQYKNDVIQTVNFHNANAREEMKEAIRKAELHNLNATKEMEEAIRKAELHNAKNLRKLQDPGLKLYVAKLIETENFENALKRKKLFKILKVLIISSASIAFLNICFVLINKQIIKNEIKNELKTTFATGVKELDAGNYTKSRELFNKVLDLDPKFKEAELGLIKINKIEAKEFFDLGEKTFNDPSQYSVAIDWYKKALDLDPEFKEAKIALLEINKKKAAELLLNGKRELNNENYGKARDWFKKALELDPEFKEAKIELLKLTEITKKKAAEPMLNGERELNNKNYGKARDWFKKALELDPEFKEAKIALKNLEDINNEKVLVLLGNRELCAGNYFEAINLFKKALLINPSLEYARMLVKSSEEKYEQFILGQKAFLNKQFNSAYSFFNNTKSGPDGFYFRGRFPEAHYKTTLINFYHTKRSNYVLDIGVYQLKYFMSPEHPLYEESKKLIKEVESHLGYEVKLKKNSHCEGEINNLDLKFTK